MHDLQQSRSDFVDEASMENIDLRNAAGLRKPASLFFHCISCDRPIDVNMRGSQAPVPSNFPGKKSKGPYTTYELDQVKHMLSFEILVRQPL